MNSIGTAESACHRPPDPEPATLVQGTASSHFPTIAFIGRPNVGKSTFFAHASGRYAEAANLPGFEFVTWVGLVAPAGTPAAIVDKLSDAMRRAVGTAEIRERFAKLGFEAVGSAPAEFAAFIAEDRARYKRVIDSAGIRVE